LPDICAAEATSFYGVLCPGIRSSAAVRAGQRDILNNLFGIADRIGDAELPREGIERLLKLGGSEQHVAALETCRRWLKDFIIPLPSTLTVTRVDSGS
jgi:hypothetical protein